MTKKDDPGIASLIEAETLFAIAMANEANREAMRQGIAEAGKSESRADSEK